MLRMEYKIENFTQGNSLYGRSEYNENLERFLGTNVRIVIWIFVLLSIDEAGIYSVDL